MTLEGLQSKIDEIMEDDSENTEADMSCGPDLLSADDQLSSSRHGTLLDGDFDEAESAHSFQAALADFRGAQLQRAAEQSESLDIT